MSLSAQSVEKSLSELWRPLPGEKQEGGLKRVYTTNVVAYASDHEEGFRIERILNDLALTHPGRYILIRPAADTTEAPLRYYVWGHCLSWKEKDQRVCCDMVKLVAQKEVIENLYSFTFSLLVPDLPVEFWWPGNLPYRNPFFNRVANQSSRVWMDSSKFKNPAPSVSRIAALWDDRYPHTLLGDMNWIRIQRWRSLIAELFDGEWGSYLKDIRQVTVEYAEGQAPTRSFFLACWLAQQLNWKYRGPRFADFPDEISFEGPKGPVQVLLKGVPVADKQDRIFAVGLLTGGEKPGIFTVVRDEDPHCIIARSEIDHKQAFSRTVAFEHIHSNELLEDGLKHLGPDKAWKNTLRMMGSVLEMPAPATVEGG